MKPGVSGLAQTALHAGRCSLSTGEERLLLTGAGVSLQTLFVFFHATTFFNCVNYGYLSFKEEKEIKLEGCNCVRNIIWAAM